MHTSFFTPKAWRIVCPKCRNIETSSKETCANCDSPSVVMVKKTHGGSLGNTYTVVKQCTNGICQTYDYMAGISRMCGSCGTQYSGNSYQWLGPNILGGSQVFLRAAALAGLGAFASYFACFEWLKLPYEEVQRIQVVTAVALAFVLMVYSRRNSTWYPAGYRTYG